MFPLEEEYNKDTSVTPRDIQSLREWLNTQPHLPAEHITDLDLILAFHCSGRSFAVTKQLIDSHYTTMTLLTSYFLNRKVDKVIDECLNYTLMAPLATRGLDGSAAIYLRIVNTDPKIFNLENCMRTIIMVLDLWQYQEGTWPGLMVISDFKGFSLSHLAKIDLFNVKNFLHYVQEALLVKLKGLHIINAPSYINKLIMLIRPFMKAELMNIFHVHYVGSKDLEKFFPMNALPLENSSETKGNTLKDYQHKVLTNLKSNTAFFEESNKKRVNETLRPGPKNTLSDISGGMEGSFKKLEID